MCMQRPEEGVESLGTEPIGSVSPQILGTKQEMLLTTEPCSECLMSQCLHLGVERDSIVLNLSALSSPSPLV